MINCLKCQVPNPDSATVCAACGTALVGQQFAQALDQAMGAPPAPGQPAAAPPAAPPAAPSMVPPQDFAPMPQPMVDPAQAQAEINRFMSEQRARKRTKMIIYVVLALIVGGIVAFFLVNSSRKKELKQNAALFYQNFNKTDDDVVGQFFRCVVRASGIDIHKADNTQQLTDGLEKAFNNFPKTQSGYIRDKCMPNIAAALEDLDKLKPPSSAFAEPLEGFKTALKEVRSTFEVYAAVIEKRKNEAADEQEVRNMNGDFHKVVEEKDAKLALEYFNLITCAVPDLPKMARKITKPPDTQPLVEYIYNTCKANPKFADKLRKECFATRKDNQKKTGEYNLLVNRMAGDMRDLEAINDCFRRANKGFALGEIEAVAKVFIKYAEARGKVKAEMAKVKHQLAD
jgi:hypothetical protein